MAFGAVAGLLAQWGVIRMFQMTPRQLLRWGRGLRGARQPAGGAGARLFAATVVAGYAVASLSFGFA